MRDWSRLRRETTAPIGVLLRQLLHDAGLSQEELARRVGKSNTWISRVIHGTDRPDVEDVKKVADVLGVQPEPLFVALGWLAPGYHVGERVLPASYARLASLLPAGWERQLAEWDDVDEELASKAMHLIFDPRAFGRRHHPAAVS